MAPNNSKKLSRESSLISSHDGILSITSVNGKRFNEYHVDESTANTDEAPALPQSSHEAVRDLHERECGSARNRDDLYGVSRKNIWRGL